MPTAGDARGAPLDRTVATDRAPTDDETLALRFAWRVCRSDLALGLIHPNRTRIACEPAGCMIIARATPAQP